MDISTIYHLIIEHGYIALFLLYVVGLFVFPVPNEVLLMEGSVIATTTYFSLPLTFITIFLAIMCHGTILFCCGRFSHGYMHRLSNQAKWQKRMEKGKNVFQKYGLKSATFSYFFPFIRHAVPFSIGLANMRYIFFALLSFSSAFVWCGLYFFIGFYYGRSIHDWSSFIDQMIFTLAVLFIVVIILLLVEGRRRKMKTSLK